MAVPEVATYSVEAKVAAHTAFRDLIDAQTDPGCISLFTSADVWLVDVPLARPCGLIDPVTGRLDFSPTISLAAEASGIAAYAVMYDGNKDVGHLSLPARVGSVAQSGYLVLNALSIVEGAQVSIVSASMG